MDNTFQNSKKKYLVKLGADKLFRVKICQMRAQFVCWEGEECINAKVSALWGHPYITSALRGEGG